MSRIDDIVARTVDEFEGGFTNHPADRGGPTSMGITQATLSEWRGRPATVEDVRTLSRADAVAIYRARYWDAPGIGLLPEALQPVVFDMAVNHGPRTAIRLLQRALNGLGRGVAADGILGHTTAFAAARAIADLGTASVVNAVCDRRRRFYDAIVVRDPSQAAFEAGWRRRCDAFRIDHSPQPPRRPS